jgi:hypothetical protein
VLEPLVEAVVSALPNAVVIFSPQGNVLAYNSKALELFGFNSMQDKSVEDLAQTCTLENGSPIASSIFVSPQANEPRRFMIRSKKTGKWILVYASPVALFASKDVHIFDLPRLRRKYKDVDALTPNLYTALGKVIQYAKDIGFLK